MNQVRKKQLKISEELPRKGVGEEEEEEEEERLFGKINVNYA